ncbi:hypothetical protein CHS0354_027352 [Potamilus streckersoni]|uniref:Adenylate kinase active site lid domain-containing protein n=1 Tax=Potamilus streckersoni TaxID=2493646 RepID=A0AAE0SQA6_9BIVA|nr:hypothetical protein CHS0354_027352 [Potamilus streckersoni]
MQLMTPLFPYLSRLSKEGEAGQAKITKYTRYFGIILSFIQAIGITSGIRTMTSPTGQLLVLSSISSWNFSLIGIVTLTTGTAIVMWMGEQISERGIGNGVSLIIFAGIVSQIPFGMFSTLQLFANNELSLLVLIVVAAVIIAGVLFVVYVETSVRRLPVQYPRRVIGRSMVGGQSSFFPFKINSSGVIPPIFASSILAFPATITTFYNDVPLVRSIGAELTPNKLIYNLIFVVLIFLFAYFYTAVQFNPVKLSEELKKYGVLVPDDVIIRMVEEKLKRQDNFILDGFPRNISQAERLDSFLNSNRKKIDHVLYFHIDEALLVERITGRRINPNTGKEYHIKYNPPKVSGICDTDGSSLVQRPDDTEEKIRVRYATFEKETIPLIDFYKKKGNLIQIDASQDISDISRHISSVIKL